MNNQEIFQSLCLLVLLTTLFTSQLILALFLRMHDLYLRCFWILFKRFRYSVSIETLNY